MFLALSTWASGAWGWITRNPVAQFAIAMGLAVIGWKTIEWRLRESGARDERLKNMAREAEIKVETAQRQAEIKQQETRYADEALQARDSDLHYPSSGGVPDDIAEVLFRNSRGSKPDSR